MGLKFWLASGAKLAVQDNGSSIHTFTWAFMLNMNADERFAIFARSINIGPYEVSLENGALTVIRLGDKLNWVNADGT